MTGFETPFCERVGIRHPVVQAPIGSATNPELAAAVSDAGGLGMLAVTWRDRDETRDVVAATREATDEPFGVNVVVDDATTDVPPVELIDASLSAGADVISVSFGPAAEYVERVHDASGILLQTVGSGEEAGPAAEAGVDVVVAQGWEAGGHVQSEVATMPLVPRVADAVDVPVVAAGGIGDGRGLAAALALGADAAWLGTRFVTTREAGVHEEYRDRVLGARETATAYTDLFEKGWPGMPHRVLRNDTIAEWEAAGRPDPGDRPGEDDVVAHGDDGPIERYAEALATPDVSGSVEDMALFAGQSAGMTTEAKSAGDVVEALVTEAEAALDRVGRLRAGDGRQ